jgi:uncharacterized protein YndB with AHSA1/START domain
MGKTKFSYVIYLAASVEKVWQALLDPEMTRQYWEHENVSDWKPGSTWQHRRFDEARTVDMVGEVVEIDPPRRLVFTWAIPAEVADRSKHSRVTYEIELVDKDMTRLSVTHDELEADSWMMRAVSDGWPRVLSSLKSFLETGRPLNTWAGEEDE